MTSVVVVVCKYLWEGKSYYTKTTFLIVCARRRHTRDGYFFLSGKVISAGIMFFVFGFMNNKWFKPIYSVIKETNRPSLA